MQTATEIAALHEQYLEPPEPVEEPSDMVECAVCGNLFPKEECTCYPDGDYVCEDHDYRYVWEHSGKYRLPYVMDHVREVAQAWYKWLNTSAKDAVLIQAFLDSLLSCNADCSEFLEDYCRDADDYYECAKRYLQCSEDESL